MAILCETLKQEIVVDNCYGTALIRRVNCAKLRTYSARHVV